MNISVKEIIIAIIFDIIIFMNIRIIVLSIIAIMLICVGRG